MKKAIVTILVFTSIFCGKTKTSKIENQNLNKELLANQVDSVHQNQMSNEDTRNYRKDMDRFQDSVLNEYWEQIRHEIDSMSYEPF